MKVVGRFAPTPSGRMHMGNLFAALLAWLSVRSQGGTMVLRMEDLDTQRTSSLNSDRIRRDLEWLGLDWDVETEPQSLRTERYLERLSILEKKGLLYPCFCTRSRLHSLTAPHASEGVFVYDGHCLNLTEEEKKAMGRPPSWRVQVPDEEVSFVDGLQGPYEENLKTQCGDFVVRRADGAFVYQLAVVVDDGDSGVTEVVRGRDLLNSTPRQMYLQRLFGYDTPKYYHVPMLMSSDGRRLSKRDRDMDLEELSGVMSAQAIVGRLAQWAGLHPTAEPITPQELVKTFSWERVIKEDVFIRDFDESMQKDKGVI